MRKKFIDVICLNDQAGNLKPLFIIWDDLYKIPVLKVKEVCPRASLKVGGSGLRYTCVFESNRVRHLYYDRGKWYVEMQDHML